MPIPLPASLPDGPARVAAGAALLLVTAAAIALGATAGSAAAAAPGRCTDDVNVRAEPDPTAEVVGLCATGTVVEVGERRDGFVRLPELGGWSAERYVAVDGEPTGPAPDEEITLDDESTDDEGTDGGGTTVTEPSQYVVEDGVTRTTTEENQIGADEGAEGEAAPGGPGGPRFQRWMPAR
jgi:hypothetical protein